MSLTKRSFIKPVAAAIILVLIISAIAIFILPRYIYVSPFSSFYASGVVDHKKIGYGVENGIESKTYTVSVVLFNDDPVNGIQSGEALAYIVPKADWDMISWGDTIKLKLLPHAKAEVVELYPTLSSPEWQQQQLSLTVDLTSDKNRYTIGENANFTVHLKNASLSPGDSTHNVSVSIFQSSLFYIFQNGKTIKSHENPLTIKSLSLQPSQEFDYNFIWSLENIPPGVYFVRAYIGYLTDNEETTLTCTTTIFVFE